MCKAEGEHLPIPPGLKPPFECAHGRPQIEAVSANAVHWTCLADRCRGVTFYKRKETDNGEED